MKRKLLLSIAFLAALMITLSILPLASAATQVENGVQIKLTTDKEAYQTGDTIECKLEVVNDNEQELTISYDVVLPEGLSLSASERGILMVTAGGNAVDSFALQAQGKGADTLPSTGDGFPLEAVIVLVAVSGSILALLLKKKTRFMAFMLLFVMLFGIAAPLASNTALADTYPEDAYQVDFTEEISEGAFEKKIDAEELRVLQALPQEEIVESLDWGDFELTQKVLLDGQFVTIKVIGTISSAEKASNAAVMKALGTVDFKPITILSKTKFKLTWSKVPGATHYEVWHSSGGTYLKRATTTATTWTTNYGAEGLINTYKVRAIVKSGDTVTAKGPYSTRTCYGMATPTIVSVGHTSSSSEDVRIRWNAASFCTGYYVYRSFTGDPGTYSLIGTTSATSFVDKWRNGYYKIRPYYTAKNGIAYSGPASALKAMPPQYRALIIGQTYVGSTTSTALPGCANDASAMVGMLRNTAGSVGNYRSIDITKKLNLNYDDFEPAIKAAFQRAKADDVSLVYYSGHGAYWGYDYYLNGSWVSMDHYAVESTNLRNWLDAVPGKKVIIMDSCYSGKMIGKEYGSNVMPKGDYVVTSDVTRECNASFISAFSNNASERSNLAASDYFVLTSSNGYQSSWEAPVDWYGRRGGLFTIHMLNGSGYSHPNLCKTNDLFADKIEFAGNGDNDLSLHEVYYYTKDAVDYATQDKGIYQNTQVYPSFSTQIIWGR